MGWTALTDIRSRGAGGSAPLVIILALAAGLRLYGLDWGIASLRDFRLDGQSLSARQAGFHPDSEFLTSATEGLKRSIHPHIVVDGQVRLFSSYGPAFMYLHWVTAKALSIFARFEPFNLEDVRDADWTQVSGRVLAALAGVLTVLVTHRIGARLYGREAGLAAALLLAVTPFHIQASHFSTVDTLLGLWAALALLQFWRVTERGAMRDYAASGGMLGLACATKLYAVILFVPLVAAHLIRKTGERGKGKGESEGQPALAFRLSPFSSLADRRLLAAFGVCAGTFLLLAPSALLRFGDYFDPGSALTATSAFRATAGQTFFRGMMHFAGTRPYLYYLTDLFPAGMGFPLEALVLGGIAWAGVRRRREDLVLLSFVVVFFLIMGRPQAKYLRYFIPWMPAVCVLCGRALSEARGVRGQAARATGVMAGLVVAGYTTAYAIAFTGVYGREDARVAAARWVEEAVPKASAVMVERGHNCLLELISRKDYRLGRLDIDDLSALYRSGTPVDLAYYRSALVQVYLRQPDFLILSDDRLAARGRLPFATMYYDGLFDGGFGYTLVREFHVTPTLWGIPFDDGGADVTWRQFDHPRMFIFRRTGEARAFDPAYRARLPLRSAKQAYETFRYAVSTGDILLLYGCLPAEVREKVTPEGLSGAVTELTARHDILERMAAPQFAVREPDGLWCVRLYPTPEEAGK